MRFKPNMAWWIVLAAFLIFVIGAAVTGDNILAGAWGPSA